MCAPRSVMFSQVVSQNITGTLINLHRSYKINLLIDQVYWKFITGKTWLLKITSWKFITGKTWLLKITSWKFITGKTWLLKIPSWKFITGKTWLLKIHHWKNMTTENSSLEIRYYSHFWTVGMGVPCNPSINSCGNFKPPSWMFPGVWIRQTQYYGMGCIFLWCFEQITMDIWWYYNIIL